MAQNFRRYTAKNVGTSNVLIPGSGFDSFDTLVGVHCTNTTDNTVFVDVFIDDSVSQIYLVKGTPIPAGGALQILDGGAKIVVQAGDQLVVKSDTASSVDVWVSAVDAISS